ncbi:MAG: DNA replication and repair protein RecF, partial [Chloroflexi bacterium]|nr:DNA replication and repair protein RecF [Chloroflexota bacterium]
MRITHLSLTNFRNYARLELTIPRGSVLLHGDNAQGKTSLLEAVYYLATSRSPYTTSDRELINWLVEEDPLPFARLVAEVETKEDTRRIEVTVVNEQRGRHRRIAKEVRVNGVRRRVMDLLGQVRVVMFLPRDLSLIEGSPSLRRRYLNITLCQADQTYCRAVSDYEKTLRQRNALLRQFQERGGQGDFSQFDFWDERLAEDGATIVRGRYALVRELERRAQEIHRELSGEGEHLRLRYEPGFDAAEASSPEGQLAFGAGELGAAALPRLSHRKLSEHFHAALVAGRRHHARRGVTTIGPQRD